MKEIFLTEEEPQSYDKCPICDSPNSFLLPQRKCINCWYNAKYDYPYPKNNNYCKKIEETLSKNLGKNNNSEKQNRQVIIHKKILKNKENFSYNNFTTHTLEIQNWNLIAIRFYYQNKEKKYNFRIEISYKIEIKDYSYKDFSETKKEERIKKVNLTKIKNINIARIQEKAKVWFKDYSPNKKIIINHRKELNRFVEKVLENYYNLW